MSSLFHLPTTLASLTTSDLSLPLALESSPYPQLHNFFLRLPDSDFEPDSASASAAAAAAAALGGGGEMDFRLGLIRARPELGEEGGEPWDPISENLARMRKGKGWEGQEVSALRGGEEAELMQLVQDMRRDEVDAPAPVSASENAGEVDKLVLPDREDEHDDVEERRRPTLVSWDPTPSPSSTVLSPSHFLTESTSSIFESYLCSSPSVPRSPFPFPSTCATDSLLQSRQSQSLNSTRRTYTESYLIENLLQVVVGIESPLFAVEEKECRFVWRGKGKEKGRMWGCVEVGKCDEMIDDLLSIGTSLLRLSALSTTLCTPSPSRSSISHSLSSSLLLLTSHFLTHLTSLPPSPSPTLLSLHTSLTPLRTLLHSLLAPFPQFQNLSVSETTTKSLLERVYGALKDSLELPRGGAFRREEQALWAWMLGRAVTLGGWERGWEEWVGMGEGGGGGERERWREIGIEVRERRAVDLDEGGAREEFVLHTSELPDFFPLSIALELFEAGRSLRLLKIARPDHPLLRGFVVEGVGRGLLWKEGEADRYQDQVRMAVEKLRREIADWRLGKLIPAGESRVEEVKSNRNATEVDPTLASSTYPPELGLFSIFDSLPGTTEVIPRSLSQPTVSLWHTTSDLTSFLSSLLSPSPSSQLTILPSSTPSLPILLRFSLFSPLLTFSRLPSTSLLTLFFTDLSLPTHLTILHSFLLLGSPSFSRRLRESLFTPPEEREGYTFSRARRGDVRADGEGGYGPGMGVKLRSQGGEWSQSGGAGLSLALRNTVLDSVAEMREMEWEWSGEVVKEREREKEEEEEREKRLWDGVEAKLSFAVRDGNADEERKWGDPQSISALDFLYLDYKPPSPLELIITPTILTKYHQIFSHLLRLMRIESVARSIWSDISKANLPSTPTGRAPPTTPNSSNRFPFLLESDPQTRRELQTLSWEIRGVVGGLCSYSFDHAVGENYALFRKALERVRKDCERREKREPRSRHSRRKSGASAKGEPNDNGNMDDDDEETNHWNLESLAGIHTLFLERVLQALFLKSKQAPLLKLVQGQLFGIILLLGKRTSEWKRKEANAEEGWDVSEVRREVKALRERWREQTCVLVKVLQALDQRGSGKGPKSKIAKELDIPMEVGASYLSELLVRLDTKWYSSEEEQV